jgi:hypothetical protein
MKMGRPKTMYMVWMDGDDEQYFNQYWTLEDAVSENPNEEILEASFKSLGQFKLQVKKVLKKIKKTNKESSNGKTA